MRHGSRFSRWLLVASCSLVAIGSASGGEDEPRSAGHTAQSRGGMAVSVSRPASEIGARVLAEGGNAVDAAVAVAFALAVTWPEAGNIGGGGFMLIYPGDGNPPTVIDYREKAPAAAMENMFASGEVKPHLMVGVPGTVRGLEMAHRKYGKLPWDRLVDPAVTLARDGIEVDKPLAASLNEGVDRFRDHAGFLQIFGKNQVTVEWVAGDRLVQPELAETLRAIATEGAADFYSGDIAELIQAEMQRGDGLITLEDLKAYKAIERTPIHGTFRGYDVYGPPPPSSGGITLIQILHLAEHFDLR